MKRATLLTLMMALILALAASVAVARDFRGTNGDDVIQGTNNADDIKAFGGEDKVYGAQGTDLIVGGFGGDPALKGDRGNDRVYGQLGNDKLYGGDNNDRLFGGDGNDLLQGDNGDDRHFASGDAKRDTVKCGGGTADLARVDPNDVVDDQVAESLLAAPNNVLALLSCETIEVVLQDGTVVTIDAGSSL